MKKIKLYAFGILLAMTMLNITACGSSTDETKMESTTMTPTTMAPTTTKTTSSSKDTTREESSGVIGGVIDDVEKGVDNLTGSTTAETTKAGQ